MAMKWDDLEPAPNEVPSGGAPSSPTQAETPKWDDLIDSPDKLPNKSVATDIVHDIGIGTMQLPGVVTGLADIPAGLAGYDRPFSKAAEKLGEVTGFQPGKWAEEAEKTVYSPARQAAEQRVSKAWDEYEQGKGGILGAIGATLAEPRVIAGTVAKSAPSMVGGMGLARGIRALAPAVSPVVAGAAGEGAVSAGQQMDQSADGIDPQRRAIASGVTGVGVGTLGYAGGKIANRLGLIDIEAAAAGAQTPGGTTPLPMYKRVPGGMVSEGLLEEAPQSALEQASQNIAEGKDISEGMGRAVTQGAIAGGVMGAGANILPAAQAKQPEPETEQKPSAETETQQPATEQQPAAGQPATEDFEEVEQPTEKPPINVPPEATDEEKATAAKAAYEQAEETAKAAKLNRLSDFVNRYEARFAEGGIPTMVGKNLREAAISAGTYDPKDAPDVVFSKLKTAVEAMKTPEQKIADAAKTAADSSNAKIAASYPDGKPSVAGKAAIETNNAGISSVTQNAAAAKEQELAEQEQAVVEAPTNVDTATGEVIEPVPDYRGFPLETLQRQVNSKSLTPAQNEAVKAEIARQITEKEEAQNALTQQETSTIHGGGSKQSEVRGEGERATDGGTGVSPEGQTDRNIPSTEETINQPIVEEPNGESTNQTEKAAPQEVTETPELDAEVADQAAANSNPDDYIPTESFEDAADATLSEQADKAPEDIAEGKYKKGEVNYKGLRIAIETPAGESRVNKKDPSNPFPPLSDHYGEIVGADAVDGDFVDAFSNPDEAAREASKQVFIVDQIRPKLEGVPIDKDDPSTWEYDEAKVMLGYSSKAEAAKAYLRNYDPGWQGLGEISPMSLPNFKRWLVSGKTKEPVAKKIAVAKEAAPKVPVFKNPPRGKVSEPDKRVYQKVADRFGIPYSAVADIDRLSADELQSRNEEGIYPPKAARISRYGGDLRDRYVEYVRLFNPEELMTSEAEDGIKTRQGSNYPQYLEWAKEGIKPPLISVAETESGTFQTSNRRRTLAAKDAGTPISGWFSPINRETPYKDPLKYGDVLDAIQDVRDDTRSKNVKNTDDLLTAIAKLGGIAREHAEGVDPAAFKDAKAKGGILPVFRVNGGRTLDDLAPVLNGGYGWAFKDTHDLGMAVSDAVNSGEPIYNAEGSERQAKKDFEEFKSDDQLRAEGEFLADLDAADIPEADKEGFRADIQDGDFDVERDRKILDDLIAKHAPKEVAKKSTSSGVLAIPETTLFDPDDAVTIAGLQKIAQEFTDISTPKTFTNSKGITETKYIIEAENKQAYEKKLGEWKPMRNGFYARAYNAGPDLGPTIEIKAPNGSVVSKSLTKDGEVNTLLEGTLDDIFSGEATRVFDDYFAEVRQLRDGTETEAQVEPAATESEKPVADDFLKLLEKYQRAQEKKYRIVDSDTPPTIGKGGRMHAPHNGYEWFDGNVYAGGQWLPESEDSVRGGRPSKATIMTTPEVADYLENKAKELSEVRVSLGKPFDKNGETVRLVYVEGGRDLAKAITDLAPSRAAKLMSKEEADKKGIELGKTWKYSYKKHFNKEVKAGMHLGSDKSLDKRIVGYYYPDAVIRDIASEKPTQFSRREIPGQTDLFATTKEEMAELRAKQGVADYAAQKDKRRQGNGAEPPPLFSDYPGFMGQVDIEDKEQSLPGLFQSFGRIGKAPEKIDHPEAERIRYVQDNFFDLLGELETRPTTEFEIKC